MTTKMTQLTHQPAWKSLQDHYHKIQPLHLRKLFAEDPKRGERLAVEALGIYLDYSKNRVTDDTMRLLLDLAESSGLRSRIDAMFNGEKINITEQRAVLHVAGQAGVKRVLAPPYSSVFSACGGGAGRTRRHGAKRPLSRCASIHPTTYRLKISRIT